MHCSCQMLLRGAFGNALRPGSGVPPTFLLPALFRNNSVSAQTSTFSTTAIVSARKDGNKWRGISALRRKGVKKFRLLQGVKSPASLPQPVLDPAKRSAVQVDENHGLWDFFHRNRASLATPMEVASHGRAWTVPELRNKDWEDLHRLWWACSKERNRMVTFDRERERVGSIYGEYESNERKKEINKTMKSIKHVLTERWYAWENARVAAMEDEEINLYADPEKGEPAYLPRPEILEDVVELAEGNSVQEEKGSQMPPLRSAEMRGNEARV